MKARILEQPGEAGSRGTAKRFTEDFCVVDYDPKKRILKACVGDWASNLAREPHFKGYEDRETASMRGEDPSTLYPGGVIGAHVAKRIVMSTYATGIELVKLMNAALAAKYEELATDYPDMANYRKDRSLCFSGFFAHCIADPIEALFTAVGDVMVYADGKHIVGRESPIQRYLNCLRQADIDETGDVEGSYDRLRPVIRQVYNWQNNPDHNPTVPVINGTETRPPKKIEVRHMPTPKRMSFFSDGYAGPMHVFWRRLWKKITGKSFTVEDLERHLAHVYEVDPGRYKRYPDIGTLLDDRTALELHLDDWTKLEKEFVQPVFRRR